MPLEPQWLGWAKRGGNFKRPDSVYHPQYRVLWRPFSDEHKCFWAFSMDGFLGRLNGQRNSSPGMDLLSISSRPRGCFFLCFIPRVCAASVVGDLLWTPTAWERFEDGDLPAQAAKSVFPFSSYSSFFGTKTKAIKSHLSKPAEHFTYLCISWWFIVFFHVFPVVNLLFRWIWGKIPGQFSAWGRGALLAGTEAAEEYRDWGCESLLGTFFFVLEGG